MTASQLLWGIVFLVACSTISQAVTPDRALCYANADRAAQDRVDALCTGEGHTFEECPVRDYILRRLQVEQEACP